MNNLNIPTRISLLVALVALVIVCDAYLLPTKTVPTASIHNITIALEIAKTPEEKIKGLSGRVSLPPNHGMIFVYEDKDIPEFWMKDMLFPLDILWIDEGIIVDIHENVPPPAKDTPDNQLEFYSPKQPITLVLEVNAGVVKALGGKNVLLNQKITVSNVL